MNFGRKKIIAALGVFFITALAAYFVFGHAAVYMFSRQSGLGISYKNLKTASFDKLVFTDLRAIDDKSGFGVFSKHAEITFKWSPGRMSYAFNLRDVNFVKEARKKNTPSHDILAEIVATPFESRWSYACIRGTVYRSRGGMDVKDLEAVGNEIKLNFTGSLHGRNVIESDIIIYFSADVIRKMPNELSSVLLNDEKDGWKSLSVRLSGDYESPSINVASKLFRLNIRTISKP